MPRGRNRFAQEASSFTRAILVILAFPRHLVTDIKLAYVQNYRMPYSSVVSRVRRSCCTESLLM